MALCLGLKKQVFIYEIHTKEFTDDIIYFKIEELGS